MPVDLLRRPDFAVAFLTGFCGFVASNFYIVSMPFTLHDALGLSSAQTGLLITPWPIGIILSAPVIRRVADRISAGVLSSIGLGLTASGFFLLWQLPATLHCGILHGVPLLLGGGLGVFSPPTTER